MDFDESLKVSSKTWLRSVDPINKDGYKEGAAEGQIASFQSSFDMGYEQGLQFGLNYGYSLAKANANDQQVLPEDRQRVNCQICLNSAQQDNIVNLYNKQQEENNKFYMKSGIQPNI